MMPADLGDTLHAWTSASIGAVTELLILPSLAGVGAAFMALMPKDDNGAGDPVTSTVRLLGAKGLTLDDIAFTDGAGVESLTTGQFDCNAGTPASIA